MNAFRTKYAIHPLRLLRRLAPSHRAVARALSTAWGVLAEPQRSLAVAQSLLKLDPESAEGWRLSLLALRALKAPQKMQKKAEDHWLTYRFDDERHAMLRRAWQTSSTQRATHLLSTIPHYKLNEIPSN